jgi:4-amino-4-deoxy-L-arabinose transferase-like glycosyltransferase
MADSAGEQERGERSLTRKSWIVYLTVILFASAVYLPGVVSPPSLMDDVDAVQAQIARNMLSSGDWVTARLDGVVYLEKAPLIYWLIAGSYRIFGVRDWAARVPVALASIVLAWLTAAIAVWAFGRRAGLYAGLCMATALGLWLFTRIQIPDVMLTLTIALALWGFLRALDEQEARPGLWSAIAAVAIGTGLLLKSVIAALFPIAAALIYLAVRRQLFAREAWRRLHPFRGALIALLIATPWHLRAAFANPPVFAWTLKGGPGLYHGFLWFYFVNEQLLRFLNLRYPRDYDTVPRVLFWSLHLLWLFPWSVYLPAVLKLSFRAPDRASRTRLLALCLAGFVLIFFTFSTTQEYYSMPVYPALALLLASAMACGGIWVRRGTRILAGVSALAALAAITIVVLTRHVATPGDISLSLVEHRDAYKLSLGHIEDLTFRSFAYLRVPLMLAALAFAVGFAGNLRFTKLRSVLATALMMVIFYQAARLALVVFDPFLSSRPLAEAIQKGPPGGLITEGHYYPFSSVFFYLDGHGLLLNGIRHNLAYGAAAPGAPPVFIKDADLQTLWAQPERWYLVADGRSLSRFRQLLPADQLNAVRLSGGKFVLTNHQYGGTVLLADLLDQ